MKAGILVMAAGRSSRYIEQSGQHKLLIRHPACHNLLLLAYTLQLAIAACGKRVNVVARPEDRQIIELAQRYRCATTLIESDGLGSSIAAGVAAQPQWSGWLVMLADLPWLQLSTVKQVYAGLQLADVVRPLWQGRRGHPVGFNASLREQLLALKGEDGGRHVISPAPPLLLDVDDPGCVRDIDRPADWHSES
ncbi:nucleotidyltransferase family protein [Erwinia aphidicola]|uniref:nucleotidyltransferase family protein n=1 Tax=Erwinia aphidicola TaxID=68334 RepID=UPI003D19E5BB